MSKQAVVDFTGHVQKVHSVLALREAALAAGKNSRYSSSTMKRFEAVQKHIMRPTLTDYDDEVTTLGKHMAEQLKDHMKNFG